MKKLLSMLTVSTMASSSIPAFGHFILGTSVNKGSIRAVEQYLAHPNDLKKLKIGQSYCRILLPSSKQYIEKIDIENYTSE